MSETSDPQAEYTRLPDGNYSVETGTGTTLFAPPLTEATGEGEKRLTYPQLAAIIGHDEVQGEYLSDDAPLSIRHRRALLGELAAMRSEATTLRTRLQEAEDAGAAKDAEMAKLGGAGWLMNLLRYCASEDLDYIFDKLSRRCPAGKATRDHEQELKQQLRDERQEATALRAKLAREGEQEAAMLDMIQALKLAQDALANCYDVTDYPADGESSQDVALKAVNKSLSSAALPLQGEEGKGGVAV